MDKSENPLNEEFSILNLTGYLCEPSEKNNFYRFLIKDHPKSTRAEGIYKIPDLSKDNIFRKIFVEKKEFNGIDTIDRCKALIKSIINTKEYFIEQLDELESHVIKDSHLFVASLSNNSKCAITLEMQNYDFNGINLNTLIYGNELKKETNLPVLIILLLIKDSDVKSTDFEYEDNETIYKELYDNVYVFCLDLYHIYYCLDYDEIPDLKGFSLTKEGNEWIKLFLIRTWGTIAGKVSEYPYYYYLPKPLKGSKEIINTVELLNITKDEVKTDKYLLNKETALQEEELEITNRIEILIAEYLNGKDIKSEKNLFPKVCPEFLIKICKTKMTKEKIQNFLNYLFKANLLDNNKIYEKLVNNIYN